MKNLITYSVPIKYFIPERGYGVVSPSRPDIHWYLRGKSLQRILEIETTTIPDLFSVVTEDTTPDTGTLLVKGDQMVIVEIVPE